MNLRRFIVISTCAFILRGLFIFAVGNDPSMYVTFDSPTYLHLADNMKEHGRFSDETAPPLTPHTLRTPGYPAFLMLFGGDERTRVLSIVWVQALLGALTTGLLFLTACALWPSATASLVAGGGMAIDYVIILCSIFVGTESLFLFVFVLSMLCFARYLNDPARKSAALLWSGVIAGIAVLIRPLALYYFLIPGLIVMIQKADMTSSRRLKQVVLFVLVASLPPALWMYRNKVEAGSFTISTIQGVTRAAILEERFTGLGYYEAVERLEARFRSEHPKGYPTWAEEHSAMSAWAVKYIASHPKDYAIVLYKEAVRLIAGNGMKSTAWMLFRDPDHNPYTVVVHPKESNQEQVSSLSKNHPSLGVALVVYLTFLSVVYLLAMAGAFVVWRQRKVFAIWLVLMTGYFFAVSIGFGTGARYRLPLMPALFLLAGAGAERIRAHLARKRA